MLNSECLQRLQEFPNINNNKGISIAVEAPTCCSGYAEFNVDRHVPLRQYFGKTIDSPTTYKDNICSRMSYGVGSGSSTVGGDIQSTRTSELSKGMSLMITELNKYQFCVGNYCKKKFSFNHVTVLYYLSNAHSHPVISLKKHCDVVVSPDNIVGKNNNSQTPGTPTIVLTLHCSKVLDLFKRYSTGKKFDKGSKVDSIQLNHGDLFVLHPRDERVIRRRVRGNNIDSYELEKSTSQFQHGVHFKNLPSLRKNKNRDNYKVSISVCFRNVQRKLMFSTVSNLQISKSFHKLENPRNTNAMISRYDVITKKRKTLDNQYELKRISKLLKRFK